MRCLLCSKASLSIICKECFEAIAVYPRVHTLQNLKAITFYDYDDIAPLTNAKYYPFGSFALKRLAAKAFKPFFGDLKLENQAALIPIDDCVGSWYSHTAILAKAGAAGMVTPRFGALRAKSQAKYAGQTLAFRLSRPRRFVFKDFREQNAILLDDLITTGTTLLEAAAALEKRGKTALFAVALTHAQ
ncbi:MAG: ComF family protein [Helicobacteraceae bacterium]|jgi:competence protein ComFC|nr:ComF family protein [Helicobacteraceae bacterium]